MKQSKHQRCVSLYELARAVIEKTSYSVDKTPIRGLYAMTRERNMAQREMQDGKKKSERKESGEKAAII